MASLLLFWRFFSLTYNVADMKENTFLPKWEELYL